MLILGQMVVFFLMIFAGALARRYNIIIPNNQEQFSSLIVNIACPSLIISAAMHAEEHMGLTQVIETYAAYAALLAMMCFVGFLLPLILRFRGRLRGAVNLSFWFNNSLFMGLPLVQGVYGDQAVVYMTLFFIPANLLFFVYGVSSISIHKRRGREMFRMIGEGWIIGLLSDQDPSLRDGVIVDFFGQKTNAFTGAAAIARRCEVPIFPVFMHREPSGHHILTVEPGIFVEKTDDRAADVRRVTQTINTRIEEWIRKYPEEWFWLHDRWKSLRENPEWK